MSRFSLDLPNNLEAERAVLGSILLSSDSAATVLSSLDAEDFSGADARNVLIYKAMQELVNQSRPIELTSVVDELTILHTLDDAGGITYLRELIDGVISVDDLDHYVQILKNQAVLRSFLTCMSGALEDFSSGKVADIGDYVSSVSRTLNEIASRRRVADFVSAKDLAEEVRILLEQESRRDNNGVTGVETGYPRINQLTHGWQKGSLNILAARPSVGKSAFALNLALKSAECTHQPVAFFSCEMSRADVMKRLLSAKSLVPMDNIATARLSQRDREKIASAFDDIKRIPLYFDDTSNIKLSDLIAKSTKLKKDNPNLCLIVVDYIGLITVEGHYDSRSLEVGIVTKALKQLARDLNIAVIALSQLNRDVDKLPNHKPTMANLRESGNIEQDADTVMLMYRSDYYKDQNDGKEQRKGFGGESYRDKLQAQVDNQNAQGKNTGGISVVDINFAKNRNGMTGDVTLLFTKANQLFDTPSPGFEESRRGGDDRLTVDDE